MWSRADQDEVREGRETVKMQIEVCPEMSEWKEELDWCRERGEEKWVYTQKRKDDTQESILTEPFTVDESRFRFLLIISTKDIRKYQVQLMFDVVKLFFMLWSLFTLEYDIRIV